MVNHNGWEMKAGEVELYPLTGFITSPAGETMSAIRLEYFESKENARQNVKGAVQLSMSIEAATALRDAIDKLISDLETIPDGAKLQ